MGIERLAVYAVRCGQTVQRKAVTSGKYLLKESKNKLLNNTKIGRGLKRCVNTAKDAAETIKQYKSARDPKVLELKRIEAKNYVSSISEDTWQKMSKRIFVQPGESNSEFLDYLKAVKEYCIKHEVKMGDEVQTALNRLEHKAAVFAERMNAALAEGKTPQNSRSYYDKFRKNNISDINELRSFVNQEQSARLKKFKKTLGCEDDTDKALAVYREITDLSYKLEDYNRLSLYNEKIGEVSDKIIHKGQIFFHGTKKQNTIAKNGFHLIPKAKQAALASRELGLGVYLTPDKRVASTFAGLRGGILKLKADTKKVAAVNDDQMSKLSSVVRSKLGFNATPAKYELLVSELFKRNGYNAVYAREALGKNDLFSFNQRLVDALAGGKQSQLVVLNPEDITILNKSFKEKISNQALQTKTKLSIPLKIIQAIKEEKKAWCN